MSYASHRSHEPGWRSQRAASAVIVGGLHAVAIYALVTGLSYVMAPPADPPQFRTRNIPADPPPAPPPDPHPKSSAAQPTIVPLSLPQPMPSLLPIPLSDPLPLPSGSASGDGLLPSGTTATAPAPVPLPSATPLAAVPQGNPGTWVTPNDYPAQDLREGNAGTVGFRLEIDARGRAANCTVTRSSGHPRLDAAACANLLKRSRFTPARDSMGEPTAGSFSSAVRWTIPE